MCQDAFVAGSIQLRLFFFLAPHACNEYRCSPMQGMDMIAFARMLDDEEGCPLNDAELAGMLRESNQLPRAGS